jgi:DNA polymerase-3 subunit epsilon
VTNFTAIDFETATTSPTSACAVGLVRVQDGVVVARAHRLIRPPTREFEFTYLHGIAWRDVAAEPGFSVVWKDLRHLCDGVDFVAAHNASFDERVLRSCCATAGIAPPRARFECTVALARRAFRIYPTRLDVVASRLGIPLRHHDAMSDAEACAEIVLRAEAVGQRASPSASSAASSPRPSAS